MKTNKKIYKKLLILGIAIYVIFTIVNQQKTLSLYDENSKTLETQIAEENKKNEELEQKKEDVNSLDFIEQMAREKLEMYYPNERVYMDAGM